MLVRYFAAARSAAGTDEEHHHLPAGTTLAELLTTLLAVERPTPPPGTPPLARIITRSSFLRNETAARDHTMALGTNDIIDVLPPFAGG